jgi:hypothetical protein
MGIKPEKADTGAGCRKTEYGKLPRAGNKGNPQIKRKISAPGKVSQYSQSNKYQNEKPCQKPVQAVREIHRIGRCHNKQHSERYP